MIPLSAAMSMAPMGAKLTVGGAMLASTVASKPESVSMMNEPSTCSAESASPVT